MVGRVDGLAPGEQSVLYIGHNEPQWVLNTSIIQMRDAVEAVKELLKSCQLQSAEPEGTKRVDVQQAVEGVTPSLVSHPR